ncbi:MAG: hypothetical protein JXA60_06495 [Candidatus Coatesbacteria bacterium]|nr:hypothetical protein [Candidatus Coatesbacteria bacterium]
MRKAVFIILTFIMVIVLIEGSSRAVFYLSVTSCSDESEKFWLLARDRKEEVINTGDVSWNNQEL